LSRGKEPRSSAKVPKSDLSVKGCGNALTLRSDFGTLADDLGSFPLDNATYLALSDSRILLTGIRSLIGFGNLVGPLAHSVLYLRRHSSEAIPQYISRRTSYLPA